MRFHGFLLSEEMGLVNSDFGGKEFSALSSSPGGQQFPPKEFHGCCMSSWRAGEGKSRNSMDAECLKGKEQEFHGQSVWRRRRENTGPLPQSSPGCCEAQSRSD